ncbi:MAG: RNA methyltransferase, partial [Caldilineae bacterium]
GMGAHFRIAIRRMRTREEVMEQVGACRYYVADARAATLYTEVDWTQPSLLIMQGETEGERYTSSWPDLQPVAIPMAAGVESLNAAVAGSIILFEAVRQRGRPGRRGSGAGEA